jgi:uncharacterized peroxidase-related enzyme
MPRIQPIDPANAPAAAQPMLEGLNKKMGRVPNIFKTMAQAPSVLEAYMTFSGAMAKSSLPATLREQIALACAGATNCDYCASAHTVIGKGAGLNDDQTAHALQGRADDTRAQAAITFARALIAAPKVVTDAQFDALRNAGFNDAEIMEIVAVISLNLFTNFFNHVTDPDVDFAPIIRTQTAA